jgi:hypothetical protein
VENGIADFRSLTYSPADVGAARQHAATAALRSAMGRATAVLEQKGQTPLPQQPEKIAVRATVPCAFQIQ